MLKLIQATLVAMAIGTGASAESETLLYEEGEWEVYLTQYEGVKPSCYASTYSEEYEDGFDGYAVFLINYNKGDTLFSGSIIGEGIPNLVQKNAITLWPVKLDSPNKYRGVNFEVIVDGMILGWLFNSVLEENFLAPLTDADGFFVFFNEGRTDAILFPLDGYLNAVKALNKCKVNISN